MHDAGHHLLAIPTGCGAACKIARHHILTIRAYKRLAGLSHLIVILPRLSSLLSVLTLSKVCWDEGVDSPAQVRDAPCHCFAIGGHLVGPYQRLHLVRRSARGRRRMCVSGLEHGLRW